MLDLTTALPAALPPPAAAPSPASTTPIFVTVPAPRERNRSKHLPPPVPARARRKCTWTAHEERFLLAWWGIRPDRWVARQLGRTVDGCELRAWRLGLRRRDQHFGFEEALSVFGIVRNTLHKWIARGWVTARKAPIKAYRRQQWSIAEASLFRLVDERSYLVDPAKMRPGHYLTELAKEAHAREGWRTTAEAAQLAHVAHNTFSKWLTKGYGPYFERPHHGGRGNVMRLVRARDVAGIAEAAERAASEHYHEGALRRERGKAARRAAA